ncbi:MAG: transporter substrate-binding domain-containing protein [Burkholderiaceae bacterium]|nr:transporter substrate-binding domain-containing protein [Burkholderiaceae bacterium]
MPVLMPVPMPMALRRLLLWTLAWALLAAPLLAVAADPAWRFRLAPGGTPVQPARDGLDAAERGFLAQLPPLRVGLNLPDNRPYEVIAADGEISGIQIEILTHLAQAMGLRLEPVVLPDFPSALAALRDRRVDLMATVGYEPTREAFMAYTLGTAPNPGAIIGRASDGRYAASATLDGHRVALERGYIAQQVVRRLYPGAQILDMPDTASALAAVAAGQADFYVGSLLMAMDRIQRDGVAGLEVKQTLPHGAGYGTGQMHFGVRSDWPLLASALSKGVAALRAAPLPGLQQAVRQLALPAGSVAAPLALGPAEQRALAQRSVWRVGAVQGLALLNEATPSGGHAGIAADYTQQVAARLGVAVEIVAFDSVAQMLDGLRAGRIDVVPLLNRTEGRAREFGFSRPYLEMPYYIVARSDAPLYWDLASLHGKRLALAPQHPLRERLARDHPQIQVVEAPPGTGAMDLVAAGQADAAVDVKLFANLRIHRDNDGLLRTVAQVDELPAQFHFATSQAAQGLLPLIDRALADIGPDERSRLLRRWVAVDLEPAFPWQRHRAWLLTAGLALLLLAAASAWWMRRLSREVQVRRQAEQRLKDVTDHLPGVVFQVIAGADGRKEQRYLSATADEFLGPGISSSPSVLAALAARLPADEAAELRRVRAEAVAQQRPIKLTWRQPDARSGVGERWLHAQIGVRALDDGRSAWTGYIVDVSSERALQARLLDAVQAKNLFVASASHELRGPLQAVVLALQRLADGPLDAGQRRACGIAQDSAAALVQLVDDVLDLARAEAGRLQLRAQPVDLRALLAQIVDNHRLAADSRGLALRLQVDPALPPGVSLDPLRLRQLLVNLVGNAIKYTPAGSVEVSAQRRQQADGQPRLELAVRDTGIGIDPARAGALFEPFGTLHAPGDAPAEGSHGLGLAICKRLAEAMGGRIALDSTPGQGTTLTLDLPLQAVDLPAPAAPAAAATVPVAQQHGLVLLVDDDEITRMLMAELLQRDGWQVQELGAAAPALARWRELGPGGVAAVVSDHQMPGGDGLDLLHGLAAEQAQRPAAQRSRLVLCSGSLPVADAGAHGLDAVLHKPVSAEALRAALRGPG